jgi:hypothetical protein
LRKINRFGAAGSGIKQCVTDKPRQPRFGLESKAAACGGALDGIDNQDTGFPMIRQAVRTMVNDR